VNPSPRQPSPPPPPSGPPPAPSDPGPTPGTGQVKLTITVVRFAGPGTTSTQGVAGAQACVGTGGSFDNLGSKTTDANGRAWFIVPDTGYPVRSQWQIAASKDGFVGTTGTFSYPYTSPNPRYASTSLVIVPGSTGGPRCSSFAPLPPRPPR